MGHVRDITDDTFDTVVGETGLPVIIDFWAPWCGPCKMLEAPLRRLAEEYEGRIAFAKVDIAAATALAERFSVKATPTFILFRDGREVERKVGGIPASVLRTWAASAV